MHQNRSHLVLGLMRSCANLGQNTSCAGALFTEVGNDDFEIPLIIPVPPLNRDLFDHQEAAETVVFGLLSVHTGLDKFGNCNYIGYRPEVPNFLIRLCPQVADSQWQSMF